MAHRLSLLALLLFAARDCQAEFCQRLREVTNSTRKVSDGLRGLHLVVASSDTYDAKYLRRVPISQDFAGFEVAVLDMLGKRGGFTYEFKMYEKSTNQTWTQYLLQMAGETDLVTHAWWTISAPREALGLVSPWPFQDQSPVIVQLEPEPKRAPLIDMVLQFAKPFTLDLWGAIAGLTIITATVYWIIERSVNPPDAGGPACAGFWNSLFLVVVQCTGGGCLTPVRPGGKLVLAAWSFFALLIVAAYTANLASFLIARPVPLSLFKDVDDMMQQSRPVCLAPTTSAGTLFLEMHPYSNVINTSEYPGEFAALADRQCDAVVSTVMKTRERMKDGTVADRCRLRNVGLPLASRSGGWMIRLDYSQDCKVLVRDTLRNLFLQLETDGTLQKIIGEHLLQDGVAPTCGSEEEELSQGSLNLTSMLGMVVLHGALMVVALCMYFSEILCPKRLAGVLMVHSDLKHDDDDEEQDEVMKKLSKIEVQLQLLTQMQQGHSVHLLGQSDACSQKSGRTPRNCQASPANKDDVTVDVRSSA